MGLPGHGAAHVRVSGYVMLVGFFVTAFRDHRRSSTVSARIMGASRATYAWWSGKVSMGLAEKLATLSEKFADGPA